MAANKSWWKQASNKIHLFIGLTVGFFIFIIAITGALYVFKDEIENYIRKEMIFHGEKNILQKKPIPIRQLEQTVAQQLNEKFPIHWVDIPINTKRSYKFYYYEHNLNAWHYFDEFPIYKCVYVNQYSGEVLKIFDEKNSFFNVVKSIHWSFLLNSAWGKYVVGVPVILFIILLITGVILWWPKNNAAKKQRLWFMWKKNTSIKRKNYDLHQILGFYSSVFALILSVTGLFYAFFIVQTFIYFCFSGGKTNYPNFSHINTQAPVEERNEQTLDKIITTVNKLYPNSYSFSVDLGHPHMDDHEHPNFSIFVRHLSYSYHHNSSLIFDENSGKLLHQHDPKDKNLGEKTVAANYDIHVGAIMGLPTKILAFLISIIIAGMPITGFYIWWGRKKNRK